MTSNHIMKIMSGLILVSALLGCSMADEDYKNGVWWLEHEGNWQMAVRAYGRSLDKSPKRWKVHVAMLDALSRGDDAATMESQLKETLSIFPDSARSAAVVGPGTALLGEEKFNLLASSIEQHHLGKLLAKKGDDPKLLARAIMAACRSREEETVRDYYKRLLSKSKTGEVPDSITQEMDFLIGPARVEWMKYDWLVSQHPDDPALRLAQLDVGLIAGDSAGVRKRLCELAARIPNAIQDPDLALRFGQIVGIDPFASKQLVTGWDGALSQNGRSLVFVKDMGRGGESDQYLQRAAADGSSETAVMKAYQQNLATLGLPRFSPDESWIYFLGSKDRNWSPGAVGQFQLYRIRPQYGAKPQRLTDDDLITTLPYFNADGSILVVRRDVGSTRASVEIIKLFPDRGTRETVSRIGEPVVGATFTPKGDSLIFTTDRGIFRRSITGGNITVDLPFRGLTFLLLAPNGKELLVSNSTGQAILLDRSNRKPTFIGTVATPLGAFGAGETLLVTRILNGKRIIERLTLTTGRDLTQQMATALKN